MIRLRLADLPVVRLVFDLPGRRLTVDHGGEAADVLQALRPLGYGAELAQTIPLQEATTAPSDAQDAAEARVLRQLLAINAAMFVVEIRAGWRARSAGLLADAMDMFADAAVYGVALYGVGRAAAPSSPRRGCPACSNCCSRSGRWRRPRATSSSRSRPKASR